MSAHDITALRQRVLGRGDPGDDPADALVLADYCIDRGDMHGAASALDRAFGLDPSDAAVAALRAEVLEGLAVVEHGLRFRYVPAGTFLMGSADGDVDERPVHPVRVDALWLAEVPTTWATFCRLLGWAPPPAGVPTDRDESGALSRRQSFSLRNANKIRLQYCESETETAVDWHAHIPDQSTFGAPPRADDETPYRYDAKPMVAVEHAMAARLAAELDAAAVSSARYALPSEVEWERAARGGLIGARYPWGDDAPTADRLDCDAFSRFVLREPKSLPANGYGLYGMCGGVWEWTRDRYDAAAYALRASATRAADDDGAPMEGVLRGGSWADCAAACTVSFRASRPRLPDRVLGQLPRGADPRRAGGDIADDTPDWLDSGQTLRIADNPNVGFRLARHAPVGATR